MSLIPLYPCPDGKTSAEYLREIAEAGLKKNYKEETD